MEAVWVALDANFPSWQELPDWLYVLAGALIVYGGGFVVVPTIGWWVGSFRRWWLSILVCALGLMVQSALGILMFFMLPALIVTAIVSVPVIGLGVWASMRLGRISLVPAEPPGDWRATARDSN
ncbi:MAG: hypothetical protein O2822_05510 [Chloroflexi bacterium]|nr:hypothetical protein [Chloroflexota bacterium]